MRGWCSMPSETAAMLVLVLYGVMITCPASSAGTVQNVLGAFKTLDLDLIIALSMPHLRQAWCQMR